MLKKGVLIMLMLSVLLGQQAIAKEVVLTNGDKISGNVVNETEDSITLDTMALGEVTIDKNFIKPPEPVVKMDDSSVKWSRTASAGYNLTGGNTEKEQFSAEIKLNRKTEEDEWIAKWSSYVASNNNTQDAKKFYGKLEYDKNYGDDNEKFYFARIEGDQDKFSNIDYRLIPAVGLGKWFFDEEDHKLKGDIAVAYQYSSYIDGTKSDGKMAIVPHFYYEKVLTGQLKFTEDFTLYPSLEDLKEIRFHSETSLTHPINDNLSWKLSFIDDYDAEPSGTAETNDYRLVTGVDYNF
jgi:putative salt-induced outer membrane protein YdiY